MSTVANLETVHNRLGAIRSRIRALYLQEGVAQVLLRIAAFMAITFVLDFLLILPREVRLVFLLGATSLEAQERSELEPALRAERSGRHREAADLFERALRDDRGNVHALFGFERALRQVGRLDRLIPYLDSATVLAAEPGPVRALAIRVLSDLGRDDAVRQAAEAWIAVEGTAPDPYREWAFAAAQRGDIQLARRVLERGHEALGGGALLQELGQVAVVSGDWLAAARHWHEAARHADVMGAAAGSSLAQAPPAVRDAVLAVLLQELNDPIAQQIAADLLVNWERPSEAWSLLDRSVPSDRELAVRALRRFADRAARSTNRAAARVRGFALERLAGLLDGTEAQQARIDAARAFADAGDRQHAERMLGEIAADPSRAPAAAGGAMSTVIAVMADADRVEEAERRLTEWEDRLTPDDVSMLRERLAWAWLRNGEVDRADQVLGKDLTLTTMAVRGWIALYLGNLDAAAEHFREAGPFTGTRAEATQRTETLSLLQHIFFS